MPSWLRTALGLGLAASSGLLLTAAFAPYGLWPLVFVGFVPAILAQHRVVAPRYSGLAYGVGLGCFYWGYFGAIFAGQRSIMSWVPLLAGVIATLASGTNRLFHERTRYRWFVLEGAVSWVAIEALRAAIPVIGTSGSVAVALAEQPRLLQPVGLFGIFGLGLVIMGVNYALALALMALLDRRRPEAGRPLVAPRLAGLGLASLALVCAAWAALSLVLVPQAAAAGATVRVAALQPDLDPGLPATATRLIAMTRDAAAQGAQLVVWPEGALGTDPRRHDRPELVALARETGVYLALGYAYRAPQGLVNAAVVLTPQGEWLEPFGKDHPVVWLGESSLSRGTYPVHTTPLGHIGTIICYDLNFTDTARRTARNGAQVIAVPSNDWPALAESQYTNLVMRAVETRTTLIKADSHYDSAIIAPDGRIVARSVAADGAKAIVVADVPLGAVDAPLLWLGDWIGWLCIAGLVVFAVAAAVSAHRGTVSAPDAPPPPDARRARSIV